MIKVGLTGNIGSGKSTVCKIFRTLGVPVFIADVEAKILYNELLVKQKLHQYFNNKVFDEKDKVDFKKLAALIFNDKYALKLVNDLIHPLVLERFAEWCGSYTGQPYIVHESAILFENKLEHHFDKIITVTAPEEMRLARILRREAANIESIKAKMANQISEQEKCDRADFVIINDEKSMLIPQVIAIHNLLTKNE